jgi:hypothetical protein
MEENKCKKCDFCDETVSIEITEVTLVDGTKVWECTCEACFEERYGCSD